MQELTNRLLFKANGFSKYRLSTVPLILYLMPKRTKVLLEKIMASINRDYSTVPLISPNCISVECIKYMRASWNALPVTFYHNYSTMFNVNLNTTTISIRKHFLRSLPGIVWIKACVWLHKTVDCLHVSPLFLQITLMMTLKLTDLRLEITDINSTDK